MMGNLKHKWINVKAGKPETGASRTMGTACIEAACIEVLLQTSRRFSLFKHLDQMHAGSNNIT